VNDISGLLLDEAQHTASLHTVSEQILPLAIIDRVE